jgi:TPR repeat protein
LAHEGNDTAQFYVALFLYNSGKGTAQQMAESVMWFKKSAEQGYIDAQANLGIMYKRGLGVPQNDDTAVFWLKKAADQGDTDAIRVLNLSSSPKLSDEDKALKTSNSVVAFLLCIVFVIGGSIMMVQKHYKRKKTKKTE